MATARKILSPQPGPQFEFLSSPADIAIYGGAAGGGKTYACLLEAARNINVHDFYAVFFRRTTVQVKNPGGLWDSSMTVFPGIGGVPTAHVLEWTWPGTGARVKMAHLEHEANVLDWQGSQVPLFLFDELTHFTESMFWYMLSRNRSTCGVRPYVRATCNPDADSWVARLLAWWIDQDTGLPIPERSGKLRYFARVNDSLVWGDSREEVEAQVPGIERQLIKSLTFIPARLEDNQILMKADPTYRGNLLALTRVERERLLGGNWKVRKTAGSYFRRTDVKMLDSVPTNLVAVTRRWDLAASEPTDAYPDPDWTFGVKMGRYPDGRFVVLHADLARIRANEVRELVKRTAVLDGTGCSVGVPEDPAQAGKEQAQSYIKDLAGFVAYADKETGDPQTRAEPCAAQWQHHNIDVVRGAWNDEFFYQLEGFPDPKVHDDAIAALCGAFRHLTHAQPPSYQPSNGGWKPRR